MFKKSWIFPSFSSLYVNADLARAALAPTTYQPLDLALTDLVDDAGKVTKPKRGSQEHQMLVEQASEALFYLALQLDLEHFVQGIHTYPL